MYKHIIWDFDGTLFDTYPVMGNAFKEVLKEDGIEEDLEQILKQMKVSMGHAIKYYQEKYQITSEFIERYEKRRKEIENFTCKPFLGIEDICKFIKSSGKRNYLYTHRGESSIRLLKQYGLYDCFSDFITGKSGFDRKPSPMAINYLIDKHHMIPKEAIMIGDRDLDILSGKNAGIDGCYFTDRNIKSEIADFTINDFQQLYDIIK